MSKVALMISESCQEAPISAHFGKAKWAMIADTDRHTVSFLPNQATNGQGAAELIAHAQCTDAIFTSIGNGALMRLQAAHIRGWFAPRNITGQQALAMFEHLRLQPAESPSETHAEGCCCSDSATSEAHTCCHR